MELFVALMSKTESSGFKIWDGPIPTIDGADNLAKQRSIENLDQSFFVIRVTKLIGPYLNGSLLQ